MIKLFENTKNSKIRSLVSYLKFLVKVSRMIRIKLSSHRLTEVEKSVLSKGLQFVLPPKMLEYADYRLPFELPFRDIKTNDLTALQSSSIKSKLLDTAFTS